VADVVAHLTALTQGHAALIVRALHGDTSRPQDVPLIAGQAAADIAHQAIAMRQRLGDDLLPTCIAAQRAFHEILATIGPADWDKPCYAPQRRISIGWRLDGSITERTLHGWDIQSVFDPQTTTVPGLSAHRGGVECAKTPLAPSAVGGRTSRTVHPLSV
jgi:hypothetical protein